MKVRVLVHALDRTGPPMLARALVRWLRRHASDVELEIVAFRGGPMEPELAESAPVSVLLLPEEAWDHRHPAPARVEEIRAATSDLRPVDVTLLVSVAAGQCLALLPAERGTVVTWVVEAGEDLHWLEPPVDVATATDVWLAGSAGTLAELVERVPRARDGLVAPEFIEAPRLDPAEVVRCRELLGRGRPTAIVAAGIGTFRKAPDLFVEVAVEHLRRHGDGASFTWIGGERDELAAPVRELTDRLGLGDRVRWMGSVADVDPWLAAADALLHPARLDSFPLVCLHAAAVGTPVVSFRGTGGVEEMFDEAFLGVPFPDVRAMADLLEERRADGTFAVWAERQRERIATRHLSDHGAPVVLDALRSAAGRRAFAGRPAT